MKKKFLRWIICSALLLIAICVLCSCSSGKFCLLNSSKGLEFEENEDGTYTLVGIGECTDSRIVIRGYKGRAVTAISSCAFEDCADVKSVKIGNSVESIGYRAFALCTSLRRVKIGNSVESIGDYAFDHCTSLRRVKIGNSVESIGECTFACCESLRRIKLGNKVTSIGDRAFISCTNIKRIKVGIFNTEYKSKQGNLFTKNGETLVQYALGKKRNAYTIPKHVTSIGDRAFFRCTNLESIVIPDSVTSIGSSAFAWCDSLTSVTIGNGVTSIGSHAFSSCTSLASITIPDSVTSIGSSAFYWCTGLTSVTIGNSVTSIDSYVFQGCDSLTSIVIPDSVTSIGDYAFYNCTNLTIYCEAARKPSGWDSSWNYSNCPVVWGYNIPTNSEYDYALHNGKAHLIKYKGDATEVIIPSSIDGYEVEFFGSIFGENKSITSIKIPDSVTSIGDSAFYGCAGLTSITVDENNSSYKSIDGNLYTKDGKTFIQYAPGKKDTEFEVPDGVTSIIWGAFFSCYSLTSVTIPDSVTSIGSSAFSDCTSLMSVTIGNGVTSIGYYAFSDCTSLMSIVIPDSVTSIGEFAFCNCTSLTSIIIPDSVTNISTSAFAWCTSLTIYCEATRKPRGWDSSWNYSDCPVVWGYKADDVSGFTTP